MSLRRSTLLLLVLATAATACRSEEQRAAPPKVEPLPKLASATQADLAHELDQAEERGTWAEVKRRWQGQTLRWTVTRQRVLCQTAEACNVSAFPVQRPAPVGWLPTLRFAPGQFAALESRCAGKDVCEVTIEGKLERLQVSAEQPTNLELTGVKIVGAQG
ncbi:MAG TPA: hypothetical protein VNO30_37220 [Kofleriaceae bacterium]|nr:hypothetical protein [Kofleriaceae bacterium]